MDPFKEYPSSWAPGAELTCLGVRCSINSNVLFDAIGDSLFGEFLGCCLDETCSTMEEFLGHNGVCVCEATPIRRFLELVDPFSILRNCIRQQQLTNMS